MRQTLRDALFEGWEVLPIALLVFRRDYAVTWANAHATEVLGERPRYLPVADSERAARLFGGTENAQRVISMIEQLFEDESQQPRMLEEMLSGGFMPGPCWVLRAGEDDAGPLYQLIWRPFDFGAERRWTPGRTARLGDPLLANLGHELRTQLSAVTTSLELQQTLLEDGRASQLGGIALITSRELCGLVDDMLDASSAVAGRLQLHYENFDLIQLMDELSELFAGQIEAKGLRFIVEMGDAERLEVRGDRRRLRQVVANLLSNAFKFTERGEIALRLHAVLSSDGRRQLISLCVEDSGIGIREADQERLFQPFSRLVDGQTIGTGLGLFISRSLSELMGGQLSLTSRHGSGSTFLLRIALEHAVVESLEPQLSTAARPNLSGRRVLVVDDHDATRMLLRHCLESWGAQAYEAADGDAARSLLREHAFDVLITDLNMPRFNGFQLIRLLRRYERMRAPKPRMLIVVRSAGEALLDRRFESEVDAVIGKHQSVDALADCLAHHLGTDQGITLPGRLDGELLRVLGGGNEGFVREFLNAMRDTNREDLSALVDAFDGGERATIKRLAHRLKGGAESLRFAPLADQAAALELALEDEDDATSLGVDVVSCYRQVVELTLHLERLIEERLASAASSAYDGDPLIEEIRLGIEQGHFVPFFQPQVDAGGRVCGVEALARWRRSGNEVLRPVSFLGACARQGLLEPLTLGLLDQTLETMAKCRSARWPKLRVSCHLPLELADSRSFLAGLEAALARHRWPAQALVWEVKGEELLAGGASTLNRLAPLRSLGCSLSIDGFGANGFAVEELLRFGPVELKLIGSFIDGIADSEPRRALLQLVLRMARVARLRVVAEGLEREQDRYWLSKLGDDLIMQGYLIAHPMDAEELLRWRAAG